MELIDTQSVSRCDAKTLLGELLMLCECVNCKDVSEFVIGLHTQHTVKTRQALVTLCRQLKCLSALFKHCFRLFRTSLSMKGRALVNTVSLDKQAFKQCNIDPIYISAR